MSVYYKPSTITLLAFVWVATWTAHFKGAMHCTYDYPTDPYTGQAIGGLDIKNCTRAQETQPMSKEFKTEKEAKAFQAHCPKGTCSDWNIEWITPGLVYDDPGEYKEPVVIPLPRKR